MNALESDVDCIVTGNFEAGTKMLFPMMMMFGIIIVIIMVPAFLSLQ